MTQKQLERELTKIYSKARKDIGESWNSYLKETAKEIEGKEAALLVAQSSGDEKKIKKAEKELQKAKEEQTIQNKYYKDMVKETTRKMADVNKEALAYVNNQLPSFYAETYNKELSTEAADLGYAYNLTDEATVKRLVTNGDIELPYKDLDKIKDQRWNTKQINSAVTQGIVEGESMDKIAKRLEPIMNGNKEAAIRNARTLVNGAENAGRLDRYEDLEEQGVVIKKVWIATGDDRTRDIHLVMDGQEVDIDEPFVDGDGNELEYPGDPNADAPETVYNCRCTMRSRIVGFRKADGSVSSVDYERDETKHEAEIEREIERRASEK